MMRYERFSIERGTHLIGNYVKSIDSIGSLNHESDETKKKHMKMSVVVDHFKNNGW